MKRLLVLCLLVGCQPAAEDAAFDVLIINAKVFDGSNAPPAVRNVGIRNGRVAAVDAAADAQTIRLIDASGMFLMPGFIDPHTHASRTLRDPETNANLNYLTQGVTTVFIGSDGGGVADLADTIELFETQGIGTNVAMLSGHGEIRQQVMGRADRHATPEDIAAMQEILDAQMQQATFGLSTGLFYVPGTYSDTAEVIELAKTAARSGGIYDTHMRSESSHADGLIAAVDETLEIARESGIAVHISHIKALGKDVWGQSEQIIARVAAARAEGLEVTANQYPWRASGTRFSNALLPRRIMSDSKDKMRERLADPALLPGILEDMQTNLELRGGPDAMLVSAADSEWRGKTLSEIARTMESDPLHAAIQVVIGGDPSIASFVMNPDDIDALAVQPWVMTGSDGSSGHPRLYGTYPKAWERFVMRDKMSAVQFVHRSTGLVAETFGLCDRGFIREGYVADLLVVDLQNFRANADYESPTEYSEGIEYLLINGDIVLDNNNYTGRLDGQVLKHTSCND